ncbi:MAG: hypothetical protein ACRELY_16545 [Polyangiaceae bacterium]
MIRGVSTIATLALLTVGACSRHEPDSTPDGAVKIWLEKMEVATDPNMAHEAFELLGPKARANLQERADLASKMQGRQESAEDMLAQGRFGLKYRPKSMTSAVNGDDATVTVIGADAQTDHTTIHCVRENGQWHVEPDLPDLAPLRHREEPETDAG